MKYRAVDKGGNKQLFTAQALYAYAVKGEWKKVRGMPWQAVSLDVELDLAEEGEKKPRWKPVRLLFVRGLKETDEADVGKKDWALFLTTDIELSMSKILEIYALRWGIEIDQSCCLHKSVYQDYKLVRCSIPEYVLTKYAAPNAMPASVLTMI